MNVNRNHVVYFIASMTLICILLSVSYGAKQNKEYSSDYRNYLEANRLISQGRFSEAGKILEGLADKHPENDNILFSYAVCLAAEEKYQKTVEVLEKVQQIKPFMLRDHYFMFLYGDTLYNLGDYEKAKVYLEETKKLEDHFGVADYVDEILKDIEKKLNQ